MPPTTGLVESWRDTELGSGFVLIDCSWLELAGKRGECGELRAAAVAQAKRADSNKLMSAAVPATTAAAGCDLRHNYGGTDERAYAFLNVDNW